jgi:hypothetical protein
MTELERVVVIALAYQKGHAEITPKKHVEMRHHDGSKFSWHSAHVVEYYDAQHGDWGACTTPGEYYFIYTEHHGVHVYPKDDVDWLHVWNVERADRVLHDAHPGIWGCASCGHRAVERTADQTCRECGGANLERAE